MSVNKNECKLRLIPFKVCPDKRLKRFNVPVRKAMSQLVRLYPHYKGSILVRRLKKADVLVRKANVPVRKAMSPVSKAMAWLERHLIIIWCYQKLTKKNHYRC